MTDPQRPRTEEPMTGAEDQRTDILAFALPAIVGEWDAGNIDNVGAAKAILMIVDRAATLAAPAGLREALTAIRDYDTGLPLTAADAGALQGIAAAALEAAPRSPEPHDDLAEYRTAMQRGRPIHPLAREAASPETPEAAPAGLREALERLDAIARVSVRTPHGEAELAAALDDSYWALHPDKTYSVADAMNRARIDSALAAPRSPEPPAMDPALHAALGADAHAPWMPPHKPAASPETPEAAPALDVDLLARAMAEVWPVSFRGEFASDNPARRLLTTYASSIAAEYVRLASERGAK